MRSSLEASSSSLRAFSSRSKAARVALLAASETGRRSSSPRTHGRVGRGTRRRRSLPRHGLGAGEHALPASAGQRGRGRAGRPVRQQHERRHAAPALHAALRRSSTSGSPASSRASSQSGFRVQAQTNHTPRPFSWGLNPQSQPNSRASSRSSGRQSRLPPPSYDQLARHRGGLDSPLPYERK